jgi:hypothetical protein
MTILMSRLRAALVISMAIASFGVDTAHARSHHAAGETALVTNHHYVNSSGHVVRSPSNTVSGRAPQGASAHCSDGSYSFSEHRRGTCSHHGGVAVWL